MSTDAKWLAVAAAGADGPEGHLAPEISVWDLQAGVCKHTLLYSTAHTSVRFCGMHTRGGRLAPQAGRPGFTLESSCWCDEPLAAACL